MEFLLILYGIGVVYFLFKGADAALNATTQKQVKKGLLILVGSFVWPIMIIVVLYMIYKEMPKAAEAVVPLERSYVSKSRAYRSLLKKSSRNSRFSKDFR